VNKGPGKRAHPIISCQEKDKILKKQLVKEPLFDWTYYPFQL
jgi:hypothetical protein